MSLRCWPPIPPVPMTAMRTGWVLTAGHATRYAFDGRALALPPARTLCSRRRAAARMTPRRDRKGPNMNMTDYEQTRKTFKLDVPADFNFTRDVVDAWAKREPGKIALVYVDHNGENRREFTFT